MVQQAYTIARTAEDLRSQCVRAQVSSHAMAIKHLHHQHQTRQALLQSSSHSAHSESCHPTNNKYKSTSPKTSPDRLEEEVAVCPLEDHVDGLGGTRCYGLRYLWMQTRMRHQRSHLTPVLLPLELVPSFFDHRLEVCRGLIWQESGLDCLAGAAVDRDSSGVDGEVWRCGEERVVGSREDFDGVFGAACVQEHEVGGDAAALLADKRDLDRQLLLRQRHDLAVGKRKGEAQTFRKEQPELTVVESVVVDVECDVGDHAERNCRQHNLASVEIEPCALPDALHLAVQIGFLASPNSTIVNTDRAVGLYQLLQPAHDDRQLTLWHS
eukprot:1906560-Rhodomonas_salina.1